MPPVDAPPDARDPLFELKAPVGLRFGDKNVTVGELVGNKLTMLVSDNGSLSGLTAAFCVGTGIACPFGSVRESMCVMVPIPIPPGTAERELELAPVAAGGEMLTELDGCEFASVAGPVGDGTGTLVPEDGWPAWLPALPLLPESLLPLFPPEGGALPLFGLDGAGVCGVSCECDWGVSGCGVGADG